MLSYGEFIERLKKIKAMGWIKTHRAGPTGIGKTLEDLLGIDENNIAGPDHKLFELKSARKIYNPFHFESLRKIQIT
jgi:hypothetical protein